MMLEKHEVYDPRNNLIFEEEDVLAYRPGGYHPVALGDVFKDGRYEIHHKLGYGGYSTVWLAKDHLQERWVALKIPKADVQGISREVDILHALSKKGDDVPGAEYIIRLLDIFRHDGPNGTHECLVFELVGPDMQMFLSDLREVDERLEPFVVVKLTKQLLQAVQFLHASGYAHGDISLRNLAFTATQITHLPTQEICTVFGPVDTQPLTRVDGQPLDKGVPEYMVGSAQWLGYPDVIDEEVEDLRLLDLGQAFSTNSKPQKLAQPGGLQTPETIFMPTFDQRIDIWRAGVMIYAFVFAKSPFHWYGSMIMHVESLIFFTGTLPTNWQPHWEQMKKKPDLPVPWVDFEFHGSLLQQSFDTDSDSADLKALQPVIRGLTQHLPSDRISASVALDMVLAIEIKG